MGDMHLPAPADTSAIGSSQCKISRSHNSVLVPRAVHGLLLDESKNLCGSIVAANAVLGRSTIPIGSEFPTIANVASTEHLLIQSLPLQRPV